MHSPAHSLPHAGNLQITEVLQASSCNRIHASGYIKVTNVGFVPQLLSTFQLQVDGRRWTLPEVYIDPWASCVVLQNMDDPQYARLFRAQWGLPPASCVRGLVPLVAGQPAVSAPLLPSTAQQATVASDGGAVVHSTVAWNGTVPGRSVQWGWRGNALGPAQFGKHGNVQRCRDLGSPGFVWAAAAGLRPVNASSTPVPLAEFQHELIFAADGQDGAGRELWAQPPSVHAAPRRITDCWAGSSSSSPSNLVVFQDTLYFVAHDGQHGRELWAWAGDTSSSDSPLPAKLVADIAPGNASSDPANLVVYAGALYFTADAGDGRRELWKMDASRPWRQPARLEDADKLQPRYGAGYIVPSSASMHVHSTLLSIPATQDAAAREVPLLFPSLLTALGQAVGSEQQRALSELIVAADGWALSTDYDKLRFDVVALDQQWPLPSVARTGVAAVGALMQLLFFTAVDVNTTDIPVAIGAGPGLPAVVPTTTGEELWSLRAGSLPGQVADICPGPCSSSPKDLITWNGELWFTAHHPSFGRELWRYTGLPNASVMHANVSQQPAGLSMAVDLLPGPNSSEPHGLVVFQDQLWWSAYTDATGSELWRMPASDALGTAVLAIDMCAGAASSSPTSLLVYKRQWLLFIARASSAGICTDELVLYRYAGHGLPVPVTPAQQGALVPHAQLPTLVPAGSLVWLAADDGVEGIALMAYAFPVWQAGAHAMCAARVLPGSMQRTAALTALAPGLEGGNVWNESASAHMLSVWTDQSALVPICSTQCARKSQLPSSTPALCVAAYYGRDGVVDAAAASSNCTTNTSESISGFAMDVHCADGSCTLTVGVPAVTPAQLHTQQHDALIPAAAASVMPWSSRTPGRVDLLTRAAAGALDWVRVLGVSEPSAAILSDIDVAVGGVLTSAAGFGAAVAFDGQVLAVGAPGACVSGGNCPGAVLVYHRDWTVSIGWALAATLTEPSLGHNALLGLALATEGGYIIAGAPGTCNAPPCTGSGLRDGAVAPFYLQESQAWARDGPVVLATDAVGPTRAVGAAFGLAVGITAGAGAIAGIPGLDDATGGIVPLRREAAGVGYQWFLSSAPVATPSDAIPGAAFGATLCMAGKTLGVGAPGADATWPNRTGPAAWRGRAYGVTLGTTVMTRLLMVPLDIQHLASEHNWGAQIACSPGGGGSSSVVVGHTTAFAAARAGLQLAPTPLHAAAATQRMLSFKRRFDAPLTWQPVATLAPWDSTPGQAFGASMAVSPSFAVITAPGTHGAPATMYTTICTAQQVAAHLSPLVGDAVSVVNTSGALAGTYASDVRFPAAPATVSTELTDSQMLGLEHQQQGMCPPGWYSLFPCMPGLPCTCARCSPGPCPAGMFELAGCSAESDRTCQACASCADNSTVMQACSARSDTVCTAAQNSSAATRDSTSFYQSCRNTGLCVDMDFALVAAAAAGIDVDAGMPSAGSSLFNGGSPGSGLSIDSGSSSASGSSLSSSSGTGAGAGTGSSSASGSSGGTGSTGAGANTGGTSSSSSGSSSTSSLAAGCQAGDFAELFDLAASTWADAWEPYMRWPLRDSSSDPCRNTWPGVLCTAEGHVSELVLSGAGMLGSLPEEFGLRLTELTVLKLSNNLISGSLPSTLQACTKLTTLHLQNNKFTGPLPTWLTTLPELSVLLAGNNSWSDISVSQDLIAAGVQSDLDV